MKTKSIFLSFLIALVLLHSRGHAESTTDTHPGSYEDWRNRIDKLEIIKSFKRKDYAQLVIPEIDISAMRCLLFPDEEELRKEFIHQGIRILKNRIKDNSQNMKVTETPVGHDKALILNIAIAEIGVQKKTVWWYTLAWVEIIGQLTDSESHEIVLRFKTKRTTSVKGPLDEQNSKTIIKAIKNDFHEIGGDLTELILSFE